MYSVSTGPSSGLDADALADVDVVVNLLRALGLRYATAVRAIKELSSSGVEHFIPDLNDYPSRLAEAFESRPKC
jgi:hypothetical protein